MNAMRLETASPVKKAFGLIKRVETVCLVLLVSVRSVIVMFQGVMIVNTGIFMINRKKHAIWIRHVLYHNMKISPMSARVVIQVAEIAMAQAIRNAMSALKGSFLMNLVSAFLAIKRALIASLMLNIVLNVLAL